MKSKYLYSLVFVLCIAAMSLYYNYHNMLFMRPIGMHSWRQSDGASFARNYYYESMNFFEPRLNAILGNDGKAVGEFPILYYLAACLYQVFGFHEFILRLIHLIIFYIGLFYLYKTVALILHDKFYAIVLSLLVFTSSTVIFYANNFLPDVPALSFSFIGYYFFARYTQTGLNGKLAWSTAAFAMAGLLKISSLLGLVAIGGTLICWALFNQNAFTQTWGRYGRKFIVFMVLVFLPTLLWIQWAKHYKQINHNGYFLLGIVPIWEMTRTQIKDTVTVFNNVWLREILYRDFINAMPFITLGVFILPGRENRWHLVWLAIMLLLSAAYLLLFFNQLIIHDYYIICLMVIPTALCTIALVRINEWKPAVFNSGVLKAGMLVVLLLCIYHGHRVLPGKFGNDPLAIARFEAVKDMEPYLNKIGVDVHAKVISVGDPTFQVSLYLMNRRGWTGTILNEPWQITSAINGGARFIVVQPGNDSAEVQLRYGHVMKDKIGEYKGARIYRLAL